MRVARILWALGLVALVGGCGAGGPEGGAELDLAAGAPAVADTAVAAAAAVTPDAGLAAGLQVYHDHYCGTCHAFGMAGTRGVFAPPHDAFASTAAERIRDASYSGSATTPAAYIRESLLEPGAYRAPGFEHTRFSMPAYTDLTEAEIDALVRLLLWER